MERENFYIMLELDFDKPENDLNVINDRIKSKQEEWSKNRNHPKLGTKMLLYLSMIDEIKHTMNDQNLRYAEAIAAQKIVYEPLNKQLLIICSKQTINNAEIDFLAKKYNLSRDKILKRVPSNIKVVADVAKKAQAEKLDTVIAKKISSNLSIFGKKNLFDFLELPQNSSCEQLKQQADMLYSQYAKKPKTAENEAASNLAGICKSQFDNDKKKELYVNFMREQSLDEVKEMADIAALSGEITLKMAGSLIQEIMSKGYTNDEALDFLKEYCLKKHYFITLPSENTNSSVNLKTCGACGTIIDGNAVNCTNCGTPLQIQCPKCSTLNDTSSNNCKKCGFSIKTMFLAKEECEKAQKLINKMEFDLAKLALEKAQTLWPNYPQAMALLKQLEASQNIIGQQIAKFKELFAKKYFLAAKSEAENIARKFPTINISEYMNTISSALKNAEIWTSKARFSKDEAVVLDACSKAIEYCADYAEALNLMKSYPTKPATALTISKRVSSNILKWQKSLSAGNISYIVVKKSYSAPQNINDGEKLIETSLDYFEDGKISSCVPTFYAVYAMRCGASSAPATLNEPVYNFLPADNFLLTPADKEILISWNIPEKAKRVEITRSSSEDANTVKLYSGNNLKFVDNTVKNGIKYSYIIRAIYEITGKEMSSFGISQDATPFLPPEPPENVVIRKELDGVYNISWENTKNASVVLFYSKQYIQIKKGTVLLLAQAEKQFSKLDTTVKTSAYAVFRINGTGIYNIYPACFLNGIVTFGQQLELDITQSSKNNDKVSEINYSISHVKSLFGKTKGISLKLWSDISLKDVPPMVLIKHSGTIATSRSMGDTIAHIMVKENVFSHKIFIPDSLTAVRTCYRLFFEDDSCYTKFKLIADSKSLIINKG